MKSINVCSVVNPVTFYDHHHMMMIIALMMMRMINNNNKLEDRKPTNKQNNVYDKIMINTMVTNQTTINKNFFFDKIKS